MLSCRARGKDMCHQAKRVPCCMESRMCLYWDDKEAVIESGAERCLNTRPESAPALASSQPCKHLWCLCLTWCYPSCDNYPAAFRVGLCFIVTVIRYFCVFCDCLIMLLSAPCPSILHCKLVTVPSKNYSPIWRLWHSLSRLNKYSYSHSP